MFDKLVVMNQQQAKIITALTEAVSKLKAGHPPMEQPPLESHQARLGPNGVLLDAQFWG
jgi:hypothetical protein